MGVDPGKSGGAGIVNHDGNYVLGWRWREGENIRDVYHRVYEYHKDIWVAAVEKINIFPHMGKNMILNTGSLLINVGEWRALLGIVGISQVIEVHPSKWQKYFGLVNWRKRGLMSPLDTARIRWPDAPLKHKADDGIAVGLLLAEYARGENL